MIILVKNSTIVTQNDGREILKGDILVKDGRIEDVGKNIDEKAEIVIDGTNKIAIPGLVNAHTHIVMGLLMGHGEGLPLQEWLEKKIWPTEAKLTKEDTRTGSLLGMLESIRSGVTAFNEMYIYHVDETAKAAQQIGIRVSIPRAMFDLVPGRERDDELAAGEAFIREWKGKRPLITPTVSCHAPYTCSEELMVKAKETAKEMGLKFHIHLSETRKEMLDILKKTGKYPFEYMDSLGLVDENSIFAHASWVTKREIKLAGDKGATIAHCPISNMKLATGGICPITEYDAAGANVTIGTDGAASNNSLNLFESIKLAALLQKHRYWKANIISAQKIFDFATINGARALGINAGSIEKGKLADIVLLERGANMMPEHDIIANLVYAAGPQNVTDVIIGGRLIMKDRKILTVDEKRTIEEAWKAAEELVQR
jgi:5-methylthioadenosine/S-adenosylhomocysteine deaminase